MRACDRANRKCAGLLQRLETFVAVMLARERLRRRAPLDVAAQLAAALAGLPSRPLEMVAEALAALGCSDSDAPAVGRRSGGFEPERSSLACSVS